MTRLIHLFPIILLACGPAENPKNIQPPTQPVPANDTCGVADHVSKIGQPVTVLERRVLMQPVRIVRPGDAVTLDFLENRINFRLDHDDRIAAITCG